MMEDIKLKLTCPQCGRKLPSTDFMSSATLMIKRTCPKCTTQWLIRVTPLPPLKGALATKLDWLAI